MPAEIKALSVSDVARHIQWRIATADRQMELRSAPDIAADIWKKHQSQKLTRWSLIIFILLAVFIVSWVSLDLDTGMPTPDYITQSHHYEKQLAQFVNVELSQGHQVIMANWQHELEVIDQTIERSRGNLYNPELWQRRTHLLKMMVDFYTKPVDLYEI